MKKALSLLGAVAAFVISTNASALDTDRVRAIQVDSLGISLGIVNFVGLGSNGLFCDYLMDWASPYNPNDVSVCVVHEARTAFAPSCIVNEHVDIISTVTDDGACVGFNLKGELLPTALMLGEGACGLSGVAVLGNPCVNVTAYPIHIC